MAKDELRDDAHSDGGDGKDRMFLCLSMCLLLYVPLLVAALSLLWPMFLLFPMCLVCDLVVE